MLLDTLCPVTVLVWSRILNISTSRCLQCIMALSYISIKGNREYLIKSNVIVFVKPFLQAISVDRGEIPNDYM